ncbi:MAG: hypothetical protein MSIBF_04990 [Candidatus Altiarchaeales archaeon IMC4]|nr:MAG: hypothetical protein MSIBF_04990 [Candidatus Altiarchaeales archaeon IMC4]
MKFDVRKIRKLAKENFEKAWVETSKEVPVSGGKLPDGKGKQHPVQELVQKSRSVLLAMGFDEVENQLMVSEEDVYKQYGPEAPVILDRVYYLAGLPRPDIGLGDEKVGLIKRINDIDIEEFKKILREYREGLIDGDDLLEVMVNRLGIKTNTAIEILNLFPEFKNITPVPSKVTLRAHMTAGWFPTIEAIMQTEKVCRTSDSSKESMSRTPRRDTRTPFATESQTRVNGQCPLKMFSVGLRFRREQKVSPTHLRAHYGASCVIAGEDVSLDTGMEMSKAILEKMGFTDIKFVKKKATSNYYANDMEYEIFSDKIEIADCGMYSPIALANYNIDVPAFNLGFGLERMLMVKGSVKDVRELMYPQFYGKLELTDEDIANHIDMIRTPNTKDGQDLVKAIVACGLKNADEKSPCSFRAYEGQMRNHKVLVNLVEREESTKLLGPAALNEAYVYRGSIYGVPPNAEKLSAELVEAKDKGVNCRLGFLDAAANLFAAEVEAAISRGESEGFIQVKMAKTPADVNISVGEMARRYISSKNKKIAIKGPIFTAVEYKIVK